jgi:hypothetical protein
MAVTGDRYKWVALSNTTTAVFMSALDSSDTRVNMALAGPKGARAREAQWASGQGSGSGSALVTRTSVTSYRTTSHGATRGVMR